MKIALPDPYVGGPIADSDPRETLRERFDGIQRNFEALVESLNEGLTPEGYGTVASAATITLPDTSVVNVTGTTNITSVTAGRRGRRVTLVFAGALTFTDGSNLRLAGNFVTTADDTITLVSDGTNWVETARSVN